MGFHEFYSSNHRLQYGSTGLVAKPVNFIDKEQANSRCDIGILSPSPGEVAVGKYYWDWEVNIGEPHKPGHAAKGTMWVFRVIVNGRSRLLELFRC
jgi:hypothetical protein